jgi:FPC/CPF motif-containing protein YcgG
MDSVAIEEVYQSFLNSRDYPCVGAKAAVAAGHISCLVAADMNSDADDRRILEYLYDFVDRYRDGDRKYYSAAVVFEQPLVLDEVMFEKLLWKRLQGLHDLDSLYFSHDPAVSQDPSSPNFGFSIKEEAMFVIGLHPESSRKARRFAYPALAFNPHGQFEVLRETGKYDTFKHTIRERDLRYSGSINPMLRDFGTASEATQYSGKFNGEDWVCPLNMHNG